ncbi:MAG TPA: hypothetical protein VNV43_02725 [Candidatus Acidoferrales bacterium]|jgi:hypothetical protein|nr:hypothetical protein [Candidatus Acidoferrales bacterium]
MASYKNPSWWTKDNDSAWDRIKEAFKRDWDQTRHDLGGKQPDTAPNVNNTVEQASGNQPIPPRGTPVYEDAGSAFRFGYGARSFYRQKYPQWDASLEAELRREWKASCPQGNWREDVECIREAWEYNVDTDQSEERKAA